MRFRTTIQQTGKNTTGIQVPEDVVAALGSGKRPAVTVTVNGYRYRSTVASMGADRQVGRDPAGGPSSLTSWIITSGDLADRSLTRSGSG